MCKAPYEHFADEFLRGGMLDHGQALWNLLVDGPRLSVRDAEWRKGSITAAEMIEVLSDCPLQRSPGYVGSPYGLYSSMTDLFGHLLIYAQWQQNGRFPVLWYGVW